MFYSGIKGVLYISVLSFALLGVATVLPESAWEHFPARLTPVRTILAERGIISQRFAASPTVMQIDCSPPESLARAPFQAPIEGTPSGTIPQAAPCAAASAAMSVSELPRQSRLGLSLPDTVIPPPEIMVPAEVPVTSSSYEFISPLAPARSKEYSPEPPEQAIPLSTTELSIGENSLSGMTSVQSSPGDQEIQGKPEVRGSSDSTVSGLKLQSRFQTEESHAQGTIVPQNSLSQNPAASQGTLVPRGEGDAASPSGFLPLLRSSDSTQSLPTEDTLPQLRFEVSDGGSSQGLANQGTIQEANQAMLSQNAEVESVGRTVPQQLDAALAMSADPNRTLEAFLELNRVLNQSGTLLNEDDRQKIYTVLDRLAFDVFYNPKSFLLEPGYQVQRNETLVSIASRYSVEPEFLAVLNQLKIGLNDPLPAGIQLKVIRGPVDAQVSMSRMELLLRFNGLYAGRFKLGCASNVGSMRGTYNISRKISNPEYHGPIAPTNVMGMVAGGDPNNPLGPCWIELGQGFGLQGTNDPTLIGQKSAPVGGLIFSNRDIAHLNILLPNGASITLID